MVCLPENMNYNGRIVVDGMETIWNDRGTIWISRWLFSIHEWWLISINNYDSRVDMGLVLSVIRMVNTKSVMVDAG